MNSQPSPPFTLSRIIDTLSSDWLNAQLCVGTSVSKALTVKRVVLSTARNGQRVVILHAEELRIKEDES